jgi:hypothetical protein
MARTTSGEALSEGVTFQGGEAQSSGRRCDESAAAYAVTSGDAPDTRSRTRENTAATRARTATTIVNRRCPVDIAGARRPDASADAESGRSASVTAG